MRTRYGHFEQCKSFKVVRQIKTLFLINSFDTNDCYVFGQCNCAELKRKYLKQLRNFQPKKGKP